MKHRYGLDVPPHEREPVAWYAPVGLRRVAREQLWSMNLLRNLDRRETFQGPFTLIDLRGAAGADGAFWFDFVADTGDGGNATTTVAQAMLAPEVVAEGPDGAPATLPEARLIVLGGDLAYPGASPETYQSRLVEMFELAATPPRAGGLAPEDRLILAIPQNHDWMDSASTFCRTFVNPDKSGLLGAQARQDRTYFAAALPHGWFLLGLDFALTGDLDRGQFEAFESLLESGAIPAGAQVILVYPEPYWTRPFGAGDRPAYPHRFQRLEHRLLGHGCAIRLRLAGDLHHYARDRLASAPPDGRSADLVTCGCGGAFGHGTHVREVTQPKVMQVVSEPDAAQDELRGRVRLGRVAPGARAEALGNVFTPDAGTLWRAGRARSHPAPERSWRAAWANIVALLCWRDGRIDPANAGFSLLMGALLGLAAVQPFTHWISITAMAALAFGSLLLATDNDPARADHGDRLAAALLCGALALLALGLHAVLVRPWLAPAWPAGLGAMPAAAGLGATPAAAGWGAWFDTGTRALGVLLAGWGVATLVAGLAFGLFLAVMSALFGRLVNNASSALADEDHKGFLRIRIDARGAQVHMLGCGRVPRRWVPAGGRDARPYWRPADGEPAVHWRVVDRFDMPV